MKRTASSHRRKSHAFALGAVLYTAGFVIAPLLEGCSDGEGGTGGKRVQLRTEVTVDEGDRSFENAFGWSVRLESAWIAGGELYYFDSAPAVLASAASYDFWNTVPNTVQNMAQSAAQSAAQWLLGVNKAFAHPGHYQVGEALGQMVEHWSADVLSGKQTLPSGAGVTGTYRSARFTFSSKPKGSGAKRLDGFAAMISGVASRDGEDDRHFIATASFADVAENVGDAAVYGCPFNAVNVEDDGIVRVRIKPPVWFDLVDFGEVEPASPDEPSRFAADSQPHIAFAQGLADLSAYEFSYRAE